MATRIQSFAGSDRPSDYASRLELHRCRCDAAANDLVAGHRRLDFIDAAQQQYGVAQSRVSSHDVCLGPVEAGRDCRSFAQRNEDDRSAAGENLSGHERESLCRCHSALGEPGRKIPDQSRIVVRRSRLGPLHRLREPGQSFRRTRSGACERIRHSRRRWCEPRSDYPATFDRKLRHCASWRNARVLHGGLGARRIDRARTARWFAVPRDLVQPAGAGIYFCYRFDHGGIVRFVAGVANIARRCSTGVESRFAGKRRNTVGKTDARLACHQSDRAHPDVAHRGSARFEKLRAVAIAPVRLRTARTLHRAFRAAMEDL